MKDFLNTKTGKYLKYFFIAVAFVAIVAGGILLFSPISERIKFGAPVYRIERTILPETDSIYELGTSTKAWFRIFTDTLCLNGDCQSAWPSGSGGSGSGNVSTSSVP